VVKVLCCRLEGRWFDPIWYLRGDRGSTVVKVLCYKSEGRWFDSRWDRRGGRGGTVVKVLGDKWGRAAVRFQMVPRGGAAVAQWLGCCATNRKVAGSIADGT
jgi:hypothetical protein